MALGKFHSALVTLTGSAQNLATVIGAAQGLDARYSRVVRLDIQPGAANANPSYYGGASVETTGVRMEAADSGIPPAPSIWEVYQHGWLDLADIYVIGTADETLRVCWVTYI